MGRERGINKLKALEKGPAGDPGSQQAGSLSPRDITVNETPLSPVSYTPVAFFGSKNWGCCLIQFE